MGRFLDFVKKNFLPSLGAAFLLGCILTHLALGQKKVDGCDVSVSSPGDTSGEKITVDVSGAIERPGLYEVESFLRVGELIERAGGFSKSASILWMSKNLNLAQKLSDAQKIYIPFEWDTYEQGSYDISTFKASSKEESATAVSNGSGGNKVNVNQASVEDLDNLPGIGPVYAQKIVDNRPYASLEDFRTGSGLSNSTLEKIEDLISF